MDELSLFLGYEGGFDGADEEAANDAARNDDEDDLGDLFDRVGSQGGERLRTPHLGF